MARFIQVETFNVPKAYRKNAGDETHSHTLVGNIDHFVLDDIVHDDIKAGHIHSDLHDSNSKSKRQKDLGRQIYRSMLRNLI